MANLEPLDCWAAFQALREEIDILRQQQTAAQESAALAGMTPEEAQGYKRRHRRIMKLIEELTRPGVGNAG